MTEVEVRACRLEAAHKPHFWGSAEGGGTPYQCLGVAQVFFYRDWERWATAAHGPVSKDRRRPAVREVLQPSNPPEPRPAALGQRPDGGGRSGGGGRVPPDRGEGGPAVLKYECELESSDHDDGSWGKTATSRSAQSSAPGASSDSPAATSSQTSSSDTPPQPPARKAARPHDHVHVDQTLTRDASTSPHPGAHRRPPVRAERPTAQDSTPNDHRHRHLTRGTSWPPCFTAKRVNERQPRSNERPEP